MFLRDKNLPISDGYFESETGNHIWRSYYEYIRDHLGYRLELQDADITYENGRISGSIRLINRGFSAPVNPRTVYLRLGNEAYPIKCEIRRWYSMEEQNLVFDFPAVPSPNCPIGLEFMKKALDLVVPEDSVLVRLYEGLVECYDNYPKSDPYERIEVLKKTYTLNKKYLLFYKIAEIYEYQKDYANAVHYYKKFMSMVPKDKQVPLDEDGKPRAGWKSKYQFAQERIEKIKAEEFFRNGTKSQDAEKDSLAKLE